MKTKLHHLPPIPTTAAIAVLLTLASPALHAQATLNGTDAYTQDFDTLRTHSGSGTTTFTFTNNSTLAGWYSTVGGSNSGRASSGSQATSGTIYSWGPSDGTDRALGLFTGSADGFTSTAWLGLQLQNTSGATIDSVTLTFDVEQWRRNTNPTTWAFSYLATAESGSQLTAAGYTTNPQGNVTSLVTGSASGLNGNADDNRRTVSVTLTGLDWQAGGYLWLRWGSDQPATAAGLGLDNLKVEVAPIPEPGAVALLAGSLVLLAGFAFRRRRAG
ncbi:endonuclease [Opitutaceae bacterium TAV5]|nr:endonuclease [Opitutaceae bacterium TAV5]